jgi:hypothetical protein
MFAHHGYITHFYIHISIGVLACLDGYMNIAMEQTEEYVDGQLQAKYGDCFIRGNNGTPISNDSDAFTSSVVLLMGRSHKLLIVVPGTVLSMTNTQCYTSRHKSEGDFSCINY